jgi:hypothetical protein
MARERSAVKGTTRGTWLALALLAAACGSSSDVKPGVELAPISFGDYVSAEPTNGSMALVGAEGAAPLIVDSGDFPGVVRAVGDLSRDIARVTQRLPLVSGTVPADAGVAVLVGTVGRSPLIDGLVASGKLDVSYLRDGTRAKWETFLIQVVEDPTAGLDRAVVIAGSDQRGTIYGVYDVSRRIGVSPWYWWDDVPPQQKSEIFVRAGRYSQGTPAVKYRGFFINDENPQTGTWAPHMFGPGKEPTGNFPGGLNHDYYAKVFEVMLRLRANYLWPAVWGRAFFEDDPENQATADLYGVVMGTSHEAPMNRGIEEWNRTHPYGQWSYREKLVNGVLVDFRPPVEAYWRAGAERIGTSEVVVTLGMRGQGDTALPDGDGIGLMQTIVNKQREILAEETGKPLADVPQVFTLYKEVQRYWDGHPLEGGGVERLAIPDDVTVVFSDDNWGNLKRVPDLGAAPRAGGYGIYYHFDYVGGPRDYKWVDTNLLPNIWEQLQLAHENGVDRLYVVNVGDMKGNELPLQFFLDYAWDPSRLGLSDIPAWETAWAAEHFGPDAAASIAGVLHDYQLLQSDRKPELSNRKVWLTGDPTTDAGIVYSDDSYNSDVLSEQSYTDDNPFSLTAYRELETVTARWRELADRAETVGMFLPDGQQDSFFELVYYPVKASHALYELRLAEFKNILYERQGRAATNAMAAEAQSWFDLGVGLADYYNLGLAGGKWWGWQTQPYVGYGDKNRPGNYTPKAQYNNNLGTTHWKWQQPEANDKALPDAIYPYLRTLDVSALPASLAVQVEGAPVALDGGAPFVTDGGTATLPTFSIFQTQPAQWFEVFNRGCGAISYTIHVDPQGTQPQYGGRDAYQYFNWLRVVPSAPHQVTTETVTVDGVTYTKFTGATGTFTDEMRVQVFVDWPRQPPPSVVTYPLTVPITISGDDGSTVVVNAVVEYRESLTPMQRQFIEANGVVSIEADHFTRAFGSSEVSWLRIPDIGRTGSGMRLQPFTAPRQTLGAASPRLEYDMYLFGDVGQVEVTAYVSPRANVRNTADGVRFALSIDDGAPVEVNVTAGVNLYGNGNRVWEWHVGENAHISATVLPVAGGPGTHVLKVWAIDPEVIVQKLVVDLGDNALPSAFGPPESFRTGLQ